MHDRIFRAALGASLLIHITLLIYFSTSKIYQSVKPLNHVEVVYQELPVKEFYKSQAGAVQPVSTHTNPDVQQRADNLEPSVSKSLLDSKIHELPEIESAFSLDKRPMTLPKLSQKRPSISMDMVGGSTEKITNPSYVAYTNELRKKIRERALRYIYNRDFSEGKVYLSFIISEDGLLKGLKVVDHKSDASEDLKLIGLRSVEESNPFGAFPKDLTYPEMPFNLEIYFRN